MKWPCLTCLIFLAMIGAKARAGLLKDQFIFIIKYLTSFHFLRGYFLNVLPYLLKCGYQCFTCTPSLEKKNLIYIK
jgi:hypothetical protein